MRLLCLALSLVLFASITQAEGTKQLAPNGSISIAGNPTTDIAALHMGNPDFDNFATYSNTDPNNRLYVHIKDPETECIYLGFSLGHRNVTSPNPTQVGYQYRVKDPDGNVIFGPVFVNPADANILSWNQAATGPMQLQGSDGYDAMLVTSDDLKSAGWSGKGDYYIEFQTLTGAPDFLIDFWDISVADCSMTFPEEQTGRVWSYNWSIFAINDFGFPNRPFNGAFYVCAPDPDNPDAAFITRIDFNESGFMPAAFNIAFNSFGVQNTGNVMEDRRSVELMNATQAEYAVFLNDPVDICETAEPGEINLIGVSRCDPEAFCIKFSASKEGQIDLLLDFDGNDQVYTPGSADVMIAVNVTTDQIGVPSCIDWDGSDGLGNVLLEDPATEIPIVISYAQGIYHFPVFDAELMINGFNVQAVRPAADQPLLYYDDSNISVASGSGEPAMQLTGCVLPCHRWNNFTNNSVPGFGNLHTINSWWFSQLIIREHIFTMPASLSCNVSGPATICEGGTAILSVETTITPTGAEEPQVLSSVWSGAAIIGTNEGTTVEVGAAGIYTVDVTWKTGLGDTCMSSCSIALESLASSAETIDFLIVLGDTIDVNGELYTEGGQYNQILVAANGCDSLLTINVIALQTVVSFDLDGCRSYIDDGSNMDYSEFTPEYPQPLSCAQAEASILFRENPEENKHSCTPGVGDSPAICISSLDTCNYEAGNDKALVFDVTLTPAPDTAVALTGLSFYERAPEMFDWIDGPDGLNNYPTRFAVRILKNGSEIYREVDLMTSTEWSQFTFNFVGLPDFITDTETTFRFEMIGYCLIGNDATVTAWDLDEIHVQASCASPSDLQGLVSGIVRTAGSNPVAGVELQLASSITFDTYLTDISDIDGQFAFENLDLHQDYFMRGYKNVDLLNGVSTLDLLHIQQHILGMRPFESPLQWIAADINNNSTISASDLLELRKVLLGLKPAFTNNTSWRFGSAYQDLTISNPWSWNETITITDLDGNVTAEDMLGIKVGDVTGDVVGTRSSDDILFETTLVSSSENRLVTVHVSSQDIKTIEGFQLGIHAHNGRIVGLQNGAIDMTGAFAVVDEGRSVIISWIGKQHQSKGDILFSLMIKPDGDRFTQQDLTMAPELLTPEAYARGTLDIRDIRLSGRSDGSPPGMDLIVAPNPFRSNSRLSFTMLQEGQARITLYSQTGQVLNNSSDHYPAGRQSILIDRGTLGGYQGMVVCRVVTDQSAAEASLVVLE